MPKILHVYGATQDQGGILAVLRNLAEVSEASDWQHYALMNSAFREISDSKLAFKYSSHLTDESESYIKLIYYSWNACEDILNIIKSEKFDIIHGHSRGALIALLLRSKWPCPVVFTNHAYARHRWLYRAAARRNMITVLLTEMMAKYYRLTVDKKRTFVISSCCSDSFFLRPLILQPPISQKRIFQLIGIGSMVPWKNWHLIPKALNLIPAKIRRNISVKIVGPILNNSKSVTYVQHLRDLIAFYNLNSQISIIGQSTRIEDELATADWLIHPALNEPCGLAVIEALARGIPVLASNQGGPRELITAKATGLLFDPHSPQSLADGILGAFYGRLNILPPDQIRETVRNRSASAIHPLYTKLYSSLIQQGAEPSK